jgi:hypothetical protein
MAPDRNASQRGSGAVAVDVGRSSPNSGSASPVDQETKRARSSGFVKAARCPGEIGTRRVSPGAGASFDYTNHE